MIYVDTSVALAQLLAEDRRPPPSLWSESLVCSRLLEYEMWNRIHARGIGESHSDAAVLLMSRFAMIELVPPVLARALRPFPSPVRTLDALHLATADFIREQGQSVEVASYDNKFLVAAQALGFASTEL